MLKTKKCKHGTFTYYDNDYWIGGNLEATGEYSEEEVQKLLLLIPDRGTVVEVGANIGAITIPLAAKASQVIAFEPEPTNAKLLKSNVEVNKLSDVISVYDVPLADRIKTVSFPVIDYTKPVINAGAVGIVGDNPNANDVVELKATCLDLLFMKEKIDLIKLDVEGSEIEVLKGAARIIQHDRPRLYVENDRPEKSAELIKLIMEMGYVLFWHLPKLNDPDPMGGKFMVSANMICFPSEKPYDAALVADCRRIVSESSDWRLESLRMEEAKAKIRPMMAERGPKSNEWACVVRLGGVGDNLIASSVLASLKKKWGKLEVICAEPQHVVFENNPHIDKLTVKTQGDPPWENGLEWQKYWLARSREYAFFANLSHTCEVHRALTRAQTSYYWPASTRRKICGQSYLETVADVCEVPYEDIDPRFYPTDTEIEAALEVKKNVGSRYIGWVISGSRLDKIWPPASMVVGRIVKELGIPVVLFGAPGKDFEIAKLMQEYLIRANGSDKDVHLALSSDPAKPHWPIRRILTQVMFSDLVVTPDTGPAWAVAKCDMPKIALLSHASPENITKHWVNTRTLHASPSRVPCWPCHLLIEEIADCERHSGKKGGTNSACIEDITPDLVVETVRELWNQKPIPLLKAAE